MGETVNEVEKKVNVPEKVRNEILHDYKVCLESRHASLIGRKEVLTGKAKFGIFGDGKEVAQVALAKCIQNGDWRSGYYRDQTILLACEELNLHQFFAQLYAHANLEFDPNSGGRQMNAHFATRLIDQEGNFTSQLESKNSAADMSPTSSQMPRLLGLAQASSFYRSRKDLAQISEQFSRQGNEVAFGTIGDASTSEGLFWETINAAGVLQVPVVLAVWDDGYGISVEKKHQTTKESISKVLEGFRRTDTEPGWEILRVKGWDYAKLCMIFSKAAQLARTEHVPVLIHVEELTQPQGHSTSGSHERYKSKERLNWEKEFDCNEQFKQWILKKGVATETELEDLEKEAIEEVRNAKKEAWKEFQKEIKAERRELLSILEDISEQTGSEEIQACTKELQNPMEVLRADTISTARKALRSCVGTENEYVTSLKEWIQNQKAINEERYNSHLYSEDSFSALRIDAIDAEYSEEKKVDGRQVLNANFDTLLKQHPELVIFGEDSGKIGGVNQGLAGLQEKYGDERVFDTGIREATIIGQGIGMALRGLRPIAEIQYLDYLYYALQIISDDLATLHYRTKGGQKAPLIIRTRGHRLEGIWHAGSPMGAIVHAFRGLHVCVPRNMTQAAGMYNTLIQAQDPALVIESLNGYRLKENLPSNLGNYTVPLGQVDILREGSDVTVVTYGSMVRMCEKVSEELQEKGISVELIDVQTLLPFDVEGDICKSIEKTNKVIFIDEDVPGGATAYMMQQVIEKQDGYFQLDSKVRTLSSKAHRPAYGSDGDYFSKPSQDDIFEAVYEIMHEYDPQEYPALYS